MIDLPRMVLVVTSMMMMMSTSTDRSLLPSFQRKVASMDLIDLSLMMDDDEVCKELSARSVHACVTLAGVHACLRHSPGR